MGDTLRGPFCITYSFVLFINAFYAPRSKSKKVRLPASGSGLSLRLVIPTVCSFLRGVFVWNVLNFKAVSFFIIVRVVWIKPVWLKCSFFYLMLSVLWLLISKHDSLHEWKQSQYWLDSRVVTHSLKAWNIISWPHELLFVLLFWSWWLLQHVQLLFIKGRPKHLALYVWNPHHSQMSLNFIHFTFSHNHNCFFLETYSKNIAYCFWLGQ